MIVIALRNAAGEDATEIFVGREAACDMLDALVASVTGGGAAGVIVGEAGVGKTALLRRIAHRTAARHRWVGGLKTEAVVPFACAADLLTPLKHHFNAVPLLQRRALEVAFALADGPPPGTLAVCAGALGVLAAAGDDDPLVVFVDDLQWIDPESRQLLLFVARRLVTERVVILFAMRTEVGEDGLAHGLPELRLEGLTPAECRQLARTSYPQLRERQLDGLVLATGGNPHALLESLARWGPSEHTDCVAIGLEVRRAWQEVLAPLPASTRRALFVLAVGDSPGLPGPPIILEALGLSLADLEPAERLGLLRVSRDQLTLRYPLLRQVLIDATPLGVMRSTYQALAELAAPEQRAWLLAKAAMGPDPTVAEALFAAACEARRRGGHPTASRLAKRSAELTAHADERAKRLLAAAADSLIGGIPTQTERCCADALALRSDPEFVGSATVLRCRALMWMGRAAEAADQLVTAADRMRAEEAQTAALLLREALMPLAMTGDAQRCLQTARRSEQLVSAEEVSFHGKVMLASAYLFAGRFADGRARLALAERSLSAADSMEDGQTLVSLAQARSWVEDFDAGLITRTIELLRNHGASALMGLALAIRGELGIRSGRWVSAYADAMESLQWATELHQPGILGSALAVAARIEAARGDRAQCEERVEQARAAGPSDPGCLGIYGAAVLGLAALSHGEPEMAAEQLSAAWMDARDRGLGDPWVIPFVGDLVEAHVRCGSLDEGREVLTWLDATAETTGLAHVSALAARCHGLLAEDPADADVAFAAAREAHGRCPMPFERARTLLCEGEALRRSRRLVTARFPLREAQLIFEGLGAQPWAQRAATEIAASGGRTHRHTDQALAGLDSLTPQELQIARAVAVGKSNTEAAAALFLSRKTVEAHLTRIYRKLGLGSRTELTRLIVAHGVVD